MTDLLEAALELARSGVAVFPCNPDKSPRTPRGFHDATTDPQTIRSWDWNGGGMIGAAVPEGTIVVDVDPRNGGDKTLALFAALPATLTVKTKSGGYHYYFTVPEDLVLRGSLGPGVDIKRAGKGYVIAPPSAGYSFLNLYDAPVPAPQWLLDELIVQEKPEGTGEASDAKFFAWEDGTAYGLAALERELGRLAIAGEGGRNDALNKAAFALAQLATGGELRQGAVVDRLLEVALLIGLEPVEARKTIESGWKAGEEDPRQAPPKDTASSLETGAGDPTLVADAEAEGRFWTDWLVDEEPPPFYLYPILPKNAYVLGYGASEAAKSMAWVGILAQGSHHGIRSSIYSLENPPSTDRDRLRRFDPDPANFRLTNQGLDFNDPRQVAALAAREKAWETDVVMIDTYSLAFHSRSEDGNKKAIEFAQRVRWVMAEVGCSVILIDHTGFQGDEPRDASAKRQMCDVAVLMERDGEWRHGQDAKFTMKNRKAARFANPFFLRGVVRDTNVDGKKGLSILWTFGEPTTPSWEAA